MTEQGTDALSEERLRDAISPPQQQLTARKARLTPAQAQRFEERILGASDQRVLTGIRRQTMDDTRPLSFSQERRWFLQQLDPADRSHIRPVAVRLTGELNVALLEKSLTEISKRHEVLRATFDSAEGSLQQRIAPVRPIKLPVEDCSDLPIDARDARTQAILMEDVRELFDLSTGPILRGTLVRWGMEEHILLLVTHHIVFDAWSSEILIDELFTVYGQLARGSQSDLPALPISYADYAHWQRQRFEAGTFDTSLAYWVDTLRDLPDRVELPVDRRRPTMQASNGACERLRMCPDLVRDLESLARSERTTLFSVLLATFAIMIQRYTGADNFLIGTPVAGRGEIETENLIGRFVNTLVLRCDLAGDPTARELVGRIRETVLNALEHQDVPFEKVVEAVQPKRELGQPPLFDVMFNLENIPRRSASSAELSIEPYALDVFAVGTDFAVEIRKEADGVLVCEFAYRPDLFDRETIERALVHYELLLGSIVEDVSQPVSALAMVSAAERQLLVVEWNQPQRAYTENRCIHELFDAQVARTPDRVAVVCGSESLSYRELAERVERLAEQLLRCGVRRNVPVGILLERTIDMPVSILAVLKAGGAYVPFDMTVPKQRLIFMLEDAAVHCLITQRSLDADLSTWKGERIVVDGTPTTEGRANDGSPVPDRSLPDDIACIFYTSGSTGKPKGVMHTHRSVVNNIDTAYAVLGVRADDIILQLTSAAYDMSLRDLIGPLLRGVHVVLASEWQIKNPAEIISIMQAQNISAVLGTVPSFLSALVDTVSDQGARIPALRLVAAGGETYSRDLAQRMLATFGQQVCLYNCYGLTEVTGIGTVCRIADVPPDQAMIPIGRPPPNVNVYVLDRSLQPTGIGVPGELYLAGPGVAKGYVNRPELTAERFIRSPFDSGTILYRTGDRGRWLACGELEFLGRMDRQIKLRGYRIEPGEIEVSLCEHAAVRQAVVEVYEPMPGERRLAAYVVSNAASGNSIASLREHLRKRLPGYMIPSQFVILDELPLTARGKVDHPALSLLAGTQRLPVEAFVKPETPVETSLAAIWKDVLGVDRIGIHDNFFDLGGHSILAVRLIALLERMFGVSLPLSVLFEYPTVETLSQAVEERDSHLSRSTVVCLQKGDNGPPFFCVPPAASSVNHFAQLVRILSSEIPFYGMQALGLEPGEVPQDRIEDMAARYIADMRAIQPNGPYYIGGRCLGAYSAFEVALQLADSGEDVALLALLDPTAPPGMRRDLRYYLRRAGYFSRRKQLMRAVLRRVSWAFRQVHRLRVLRYLGSRHIRRIQRTYTAHMHAQETYTPRVYAETITFFASREEYSPDNSRSLWGNLTSGEFDLHLVPGTHRTMSAGPHLRTLVQELEGVIYEARQRTRTAIRKTERQL